MSASSINRSQTRADFVPDGVIKILVVEDHPVVILGLRMLLDTHPGMDIVAEAMTAADAIRLADVLLPDVVLMDIGLPDGSGIDATAQIKNRHLQMAILAITIHEDKEYVHQMLANGASGYISKRAAPEDLITAIEAVANGKEFIHPSITRS